MGVADKPGDMDCTGESLGRCDSLVLAFFTLRSPAVFAPLRPPLCVRRCCSMLSLRVKALLHSGQMASLRPVCFLEWRAAWPEVVKKSLQFSCLASGHGYWFFLGRAVAAAATGGGATPGCCGRACCA